MPAQPSASGVRVGTINDWRALMDGDADELLGNITPDPAPADIARWRKSWPAGLVSAAIELARARSKARNKFPTEIAETLIADVPGIEMASTELASLHVAKRFKAAGAKTVFDLASGIGADAMALERVMPDAVNAIELDPIRALMTRHNARCRTVCDDATATKIPPTAAVQLDPARRDGSRRRMRSLADLIPGEDFIRALAEGDRLASIKLAPGTDPEALPRAHFEYLSERGRMSQARAWINTGQSSETVTATDLSSGVSFTARPDEPSAIVAEPGRFIFTMNPAIERARLVGALSDDLALPVLVHPGAGLLTGDEVVASPWLTPFRVLEALSWNRKRVAAAVSNLGGGIVEVKTRDGAVDPDHEQARLRGSGDQILTVFVLRLGSRAQSLITERVFADDSSVHPAER